MATRTLELGAHVTHALRVRCVPSVQGLSMRSSAYRRAITCYALSVRAVKVGHIHKMRVVSAFLLVLPRSLKHE